ncbi:MAG: FkbM family methyltransferase [Actinomycetota bacterium]
MHLDPPFISYAQNREDVVLWRALRDVSAGRYVEVGANHPRIDSVTRAFYDRGWSGITIEPMHEFAEAHRAERPRDTMIEAVITDEDTETVVLHEIPATGLSSIVDAVGAQHRAAGSQVIDKPVRALRLSDVLEDHAAPGQDVHFMLVDTEGSEPQVLASIDLHKFRPWVLVIESTAPNSTVQTHDAWEPAVLGAGYRLCLFDGLSRFYVAEEHAETLQAKLAYPACVHDSFIEANLEARVYAVWEGRQELLSELRRWRAEALTLWAGASSKASDDLQRVRGELGAARDELAAVRATVSWRVTRPIRGVRRRMRRT